MKKVRIPRLRPASAKLLRPALSLGLSLNSFYFLSSSMSSSSKLQQDDQWENFRQRFVEGLVPRHVKPS